MTDRKKGIPGRADKIRLCAHRGYTPAAPQNSLPAFEEAGKRNYWAIETDVHMTADGKLVCIHNATVDSTYRGSGAVKDMTLAELTALERVEADGLRMPLFSEYLQVCRDSGAVPFIETKTADIASVLEAAAEFFKPEQIIISSANFSHLEMVRQLTDKVFIHHIFSDEEHLMELARMGRSGLSYNYPDLDKVPEGLIEHTHEQGVCVCLRAGDSLQAVQRMMEMGLDYIPTNRMAPEDIRELD